MDGANGGGSKQKPSFKIQKLDSAFRVFGAKTPPFGSP
jgi:hypothetical protein